MPDCTTATVVPKPRVREAQNLYEIFREADVKVASSCNGRGSCGEYRVRSVSGNGHINEYTRGEQEHLAVMDINNGTRLAYHSNIYGDVEVCVPGDDITAGM